MQYILTKEEYNELVSKQMAIESGDREKLQKLCTLAANNIPVAREWMPDSDPAPWGCILDGSILNPGYCDDCPCSEVCPHPYKEWSQ